MVSTKKIKTSSVLKTNIFGDSNYITITDQIKSFIKFINDINNVDLITSIYYIANEAYDLKYNKKKLIDKNNILSSDPDDIRNTIVDTAVKLAYNPYIFNVDYLPDFNYMKSLFITYAKDNTWFTKIYQESIDKYCALHRLKYDPKNDKFDKIKNKCLIANSILYYVYFNFLSFSRTTLNMIMEICYRGIFNIIVNQWYDPIKKYEFTQIYIKIKNNMIDIYSKNMGLSIFQRYTIINAIQLKDFDIGFYECNEYNLKTKNFWKIEKSINNHLKKS